MKIRFQADESLSYALVQAVLLTTSQIAEEVFLIWLVMEAEEWVNRITYLPV